MRVVYVTSSLPHGKGEAFVIPEIQELRTRGHEVLIVPMYPRDRVLHGDVRSLLEHSVVRRLISTDILAAALSEAWRAPSASARLLARLFKSRSLKILLKNLLVLPKGMWLASLAREWRADHVHVHWAATSATMGLVCGGLSGIPWSITAHRFDIAENNLIGEKAREAGFVRCIDERGARELSGHLSPEAEQPVVIHMGVELPESPGRRPPTREGTIRMVMAANLVEKKGHACLLEAVGLLRDRGVAVSVDLAGDGPLHEDLVRRAMSLGVEDRVSFLGVLPHQELLTRLRNGEWDVLVLPSIVTRSGEKEGIPVALVEAMGSRLPVISTTTGGMPELFEGIPDPPLVPPGDPVALCGAMERMLGDPGYRERLIEEGYRRIEESFAIQQVMSEMISRFEAASGCAAEPSPWSSTAMAVLPEEKRSRAEGVGAASGEGSS